MVETYLAMVFFLFALGILLLIKGADWLVKGASGLARHLGVSDFAVGLTVVAFGTSMPELTVNVLASAQGNPAIAIGNVLGSNVANILLILGASLLIRGLVLHRNTVIAEIPFSILAALLAGFLVNTALFSGNEGMLMLDRSEGLVMLLFFFLFLVYVMDMALEEKVENGVEGQQNQASFSVRRGIGMSIAGIGGLFLGGKWVVDGAVVMAEWMGMSQAFIGLTVVAVGTSLPELVTSVMAAWRGSSDLAVANIIGSNIFNLLFILGLSAVIEPLPFDAAGNIDILVVVLASVLVILGLVIGRRWHLKRYDGVIFLLVYGAYMYYLIGRG